MARPELRSDDGGSFLESRDYARVRFAGDSGDGMQLTGTQFAASTALAQNDFATLPDYPAEIRAPVGTVYGVSSYSINFGSTEIFTSGDRADLLVVMNPAGLKTQIDDLRTGGLIIFDEGAFTDRNLTKAGYGSSPVDDGSLAPYQTLPINMTQLTLQAVEGYGLGRKNSLRCKNMWALGLVLWIFKRDRTSITDWLNKKFAAVPELAAANVAALNAGHAYGETAEIPEYFSTISMPPAALAPGEYRTATGIESLGLGLIAAAKLADLPLYFASYPITPASPLLHLLSRHKDQGVVTFQAEDEIAAVCSAIGASFSGCLAVTSSSGPGIALKTEAIGLAVAAELPLVVVNVQRGGPSTGLPTKTEQSDLLQAVYGRNGDTPLPVIAASNAQDCFECAIEAARLAIKYMTPVMLLLDGYIANAAEPWRLPDLDDIGPIDVDFRQDPNGFQPYLRVEETLARPWAVPGTPGLEHRIGGLERDADTGNISYDPVNHDLMTRIRSQKILGIAKEVPPQEIGHGDESGDIVVVGWGASYGPLRMATKRARDRGVSVSHVHLRHIWPLPENLGEVLSKFKKVLVAEMNTGQLLVLLRAHLLIDAKGLNKITGRPFRIFDLLEEILAEANRDQESQA